MLKGQAQITKVMKQTDQSNFNEFQTMQQLEKYEPKQRDLIIKFGLKFFQCIQETSQIDQIPIQPNEVPSIISQTSNIKQVQQSFTQCAEQPDYKQGQRGQLAVSIASIEQNQASFQTQTQDTIQSLNLDKSMSSQTTCSNQVNKGQLQAKADSNQITLIQGGLKKNLRFETPSLPQSNIIHVEVPQQPESLEYVNLLKNTESLGRMLSNLQVQQQEQNKTLTAKLDKVLCSSAGLGKQGEFIVEQAISAQYPQSIVTNTSKEAKSGDLIVQLDNKRFLIEVKNYSKTIEKKEIDKFLKDVDSTLCDSGILIAFEQKITGKPRISFEVAESGKQVVFLAQQQGTDSLLVVIEILTQFLQHSHLNLDKLKSQQQVAKQSIECAIQSIKKQHTQTSNQLKTLKATWDSLLNIQSAIGSFDQ